MASGFCSGARRAACSVSSVGEEEKRSDNDSTAAVAPYQRSRFFFSAGGCGDGSSETPTTSRRGQLWARLWTNYGRNPASREEPRDAASRDGVGDSSDCCSGEATASQDTPGGAVGLVGFTEAVSHRRRGVPETDASRAMRNNGLTNTLCTINTNAEANVVASAGISVDGGMREEGVVISAGSVALAGAATVASAMAINSSSSSNNSRNRGEGGGGAVVVGSPRHIFVGGNIHVSAETRELPDGNVVSTDVPPDNKEPHPGKQCDGGGRDSDMPSPPADGQKKLPILPRARALWRAFAEVDHGRIEENHRRAAQRHMSRFSMTPAFENPPTCFVPIEGSP